MNVISKEKVQALREALEGGLSIRKAARLVGVHRKTACRWHKIFGIQKRGPRVEKMTVNISEQAKARLAVEAKSMALSPTMFAGLLLETIAEENLFGAIMDV